MQIIVGNCAENMISAKDYYRDFNHHENTAKCNICDKVIKTSGNTSNLRAHLRNRHHDAFLQCGQKVSTKIKL